MRDLSQHIKTPRERTHDAHERDEANEYTGINKSGQVVKFSSLSECAAQGFKGEYVSQCVNGHRERYVGYTWSRREIS